jgi:O-antigen/teichoic acid export membrane protein
LRVAHAIRWTASGQALSLTLQLVSTLVLVRLLTPREFGIAAIATVTTGFVATIMDVGLAASLVQAPTLEMRHVAAARVASVVVGVALMLAAIGLAPALAAVYGTQEAIPLLRVLAVTFPLNAFAATSRAVLTREKKFDRLVKGELRVVAAAHAAALATAALGAGAWALAVQGVVAATMSSLTFGLWRTRTRASLSSLRLLGSFGIKLSAYNLLNYVARHADDVLVARYLSPSELGFYSRAYALLLFPLNQLSSVVGRVVWAALARKQSSVKEVRRDYFRAVQVVTTIAVPGAAYVGLSAPDIVPLLLGPQWLPIVTTLQILAAVGALQSFFATTGWLLQALG